MRIEIKFTETEARYAHYALKARYKSKASLEKLAKLAIRTEVVAQARIELEITSHDHSNRINHYPRAAMPEVWAHL